MIGDGRDRRSRVDRSLHRRHRVVDPIDVDGSRSEARVAPVSAEASPDQNAFHLKVQREHRHRSIRGDRGELGAMHGTIMVFLGVVPLAVGGFGNYVMPLQIGAPDMAFPKLNMASYWVYFAGGCIMIGSSELEAVGFTNPLYLLGTRSTASLFDTHVDLRFIDWSFRVGDMRRQV